MRFSVIVPVYNVENYIDACIRSVLQQTWQDYELILVDDGSPDGSGAICDRYAAQYPEQIRVIHKKNGGALLARDTGIREARGDVLMFLDGDDCLHREAMAALEERFRTTGCDMILFRISASQDFSGGLDLPLEPGRIYAGESKKELLGFVLTTNRLNSLCQKAFKRSLAQPYVEYAPFSFVKNGEDLLMSLPVLDRAERILYLDQNLYFYRQRTGSAVHSFNPNRPASIKAVRQEVERYIPLWNMEAYRPRHAAREVGGWMDTLVSLMDNRRALAPSDFQRMLRELAEDPYFRRAYETMDAGALDAKRRLLAKLLYGRHFGALKLLWYGREWLRR